MQSQNVAEFFEPPVDAGACVDALQNLHEQVKRAEATLTNEDCISLFKNMGHMDLRIREECLLLLAASSRELGRVAALSRLLDDFPPIRNTALEILEDYGEAEDQYAVESILVNDPDWTARASAVSCLAGFAGVAARAAVIQGLDDVDPVVRRYAANALSRIAETSDIAILQEAEARETEVTAKTGIYAALYQLGNPAYLDKMLTLLDVDSTDTEWVNLVDCPLLNSLENFVFPGDVPFVREQLAALDVTDAQPAVRERVLRLLESLSATL